MTQINLLLAPLLNNTSTKSNKIRSNKILLAEDLSTLIQLVGGGIGSEEPGGLGSCAVPSM